MRPSSILALVACVILSISVTRGNRWNTENAEKGPRYEGEYSQTVGRTKKRGRQFGKSMWRVSKKVPQRGDVLRRTVIDEDSICEDLAPTLCQKFMNVYGAKIRNNCWRLPWFIRKRVLHRCQNTCGRCKKEEKKLNEFDVAVRRRKLPFPQSSRTSRQGAGDRPKSGVYYIFTKRVSL